MIALWLAMQVIPVTYLGGHPPSPREQRRFAEDLAASEKAWAEIAANEVPELLPESYGCVMDGPCPAYRFQIADIAAYVAEIDPVYRGHLDDVPARILRGMVGQVADYHRACNREVAERLRDEIKRLPGVVPSAGPILDFLRGRTGRAIRGGRDLPTIDAAAADYHAVAPRLAATDRRALARFSSSPAGHAWTQRRREAWTALRRLGDTPRGLCPSASETFTGVRIGFLVNEGLATITYAPNPRQKR